MDLLEDTIICLLCRGTVNYSVDDNLIFFKHLKLEHSVHYEQQFILAVNFFDEDSKKMVVKNFEDISGKKKKDNQLKETKDTTIESVDDDDELIIDEDDDYGEMEEFNENPELEINKIDKKINENSKLYPAVPESRKPQTCPICSYTMPSGGNLKRHMAKQHPDVNHEQLIKSSILPQQESSVLPPKESSILPQREEPVQSENICLDDLPMSNLNDPNQCYQCKAQFSTSSKLNKHKHNTRHQILPPQNGDEQIFTSQNEASMNVKKELLNVKKEIMDNSSNKEDVNDFSNFGEHFLAANNDHAPVSSPESVTCNVCKKVFRTKKLLSKHHSTAHTVKPFACNDCSKTFVDELNLRRHVFQYHAESFKKTADIKAKAAETLHERINEVLADKNVIDKEPDLNALINEVKRELKNINESTDVDTTKGKQGKESPSFQSILANAIATDPKEEANTLPKRLKEEPKPTLEEPMEDTNAVFKERNEESITCNECDKSFRTPHSLKVHKIIHTGKKPFACNLCDDAFNQKSNLKRHINARHN